MQTNRERICQCRIQFSHGLILAAKLFLIHPDAWNLAESLEDVPGSTAVSDKGEIVDPDEREVAEKKAAAYAEGHGLGNVDALMTEQVGGHTTLAVGRLPVVKISQQMGLHTHFGGR